MLLAALGGYAVALPTVPSVLAVPGKGRTLAAFQEEDLRSASAPQSAASEPSHPIGRR